MWHWRIGFVVLSALLLPVAAAAAPAGKVVIAQGVDPTTLDMMNQQEQPASNVGAQMFDMLVERDQSLQLVPGLAASCRSWWPPRSGRSSCAGASSSTTG